MKETGPTGVSGLRLMFLCLIVLPFTGESPILHAEDILFIGNSYTFAAQAPAVEAHGGVPKLFEEISRAKGKHVTTDSLTAPGKDWSYHLVQPATDTALGSRKWDWVVLQNYSTSATQAGNTEKFLSDGDTFSDRIAKNSPGAGILLYETWARPTGKFYQQGPGKILSGPARMLEEIQQSYEHLRSDLESRDSHYPHRVVRVAKVGTAFARAQLQFPGIELIAGDQHHATAEGYYLAALVIYETLYQESAKGAPSSFFQNTVTFPGDVAAHLQQVADEVAVNPPHH